MEDLEEKSENRSEKRVGFGESVPDAVGLGESVGFGESVGDSVGDLGGTGGSGFRRGDNREALGDNWEGFGDNWVGLEDR